MNLRQSKKCYKLVNENNLRKFLDEIDNELSIVKNSIEFVKGIKWRGFKDSSNTVYFKFKELPLWEFAVSLNFYGDGVLRYFGEHEYLIDKFRPSSTYVNDNELGNFIEKVKSIIKDEKYHTVNSLKNGNLDYPFLVKEIDGEKYYSGYQVKYEKTENGSYTVTQDTSIILDDLIKEEYNELINNELNRSLRFIEMREYSIKILKDFLFEKEYVKGFGLVDNNVLRKKSWFSKDYRLSVYVDNSIFYNNEFIDSLYDEIEEFLNNNNYENNPFDDDLCISLDYIVNSKIDMKECHYKIIKGCNY